MKYSLSLTSLAVAALLFPAVASAGHDQIDALVRAHAQANNVPEALVHRVIQRESRYQPQLVGRGGCIGLMQIKLATARGLGYTGDAAGLRDPETNLTYGIKYLAGAYRAANGDHARAMRYYAGGYYYAAKRQRLLHAHAEQRL
jgi:soluble lytic murein transglycosylase-like protein